MLTHLRRLVFHSARLTRRVFKSSMLRVPGSSIRPCSSPSSRPSCLASAASGMLRAGGSCEGGGRREERCDAGEAGWKRVANESAGGAYQAALLLSFNLAESVASHSF